MDLLVSFKCLYYSFCYGFLMMFVYCLLNRIVYSMKYIRFIFHTIIGFLLGFGYYYGLVFINYGVIRIYFLGMILIGYCLFMRFYRIYFLCFIEKLVIYVKKILWVRVFFFKCINAIIQKRKEKMRKWQRK